jgi:hypothetical protein
MASDFVPVVIGSVASLYFIQDGYQARPSISWGSRTGRGAPISLASRWVLGCYLVLLTSLAITEVRAQLPPPLPVSIALGFLVALFVMGMVDASPSWPRWRLFRRRQRRFLGLNSREQRQLRRQKKQQRLRRTGARRHG